MSEANPARGEVKVDLGSLGEIICRPGLRAISAIDDPHQQGPITAIASRLWVAPSFLDVIRVLYETHLDSDQKPKHTYKEIAEAVFEIGFDKFTSQCGELVGSAWSTRKGEKKDDEAEEETDSENPPKAGSPADSQPGSTPPSPPPPSESPSTTPTD